MGDSPKAQNGPSGDTAQRIADEYGVGRNTIKRAEKFSNVVNILPDDIKQNVLSGKENIRVDDAYTIDKMDAPTHKKFIKEVEKGTPIKEAVKKVDPIIARKERDDEVRAEMQRKQEMRERRVFRFITPGMITYGNSGSLGTAV